MELYLVQHGEAASKEVNPERPLTEKGRQDVTKTANFLKKCGREIDTIWHSTKTRAIETAKIIAGTLPPERDVEQKEGLAPNDSVKAVFTAINSEKGSLMIVGHLPFLQKLASLALVGSENSQVIGFQQGGVVCLRQNDDGTWQIMFAIIPDLICHF